MTNIDHDLEVVKEKVDSSSHLRFLAATAVSTDTVVELTVEEIKLNELLIFDLLMITHILIFFIQILTFVLKNFDHHNIA